MIVAREEERKTLEGCLTSDRSEFVAVYGRRRIGKTFLVRETFGDAITFQHAGLANGNAKKQLEAFAISLRRYGLDLKEPLKDWLDAFEKLGKVIQRSKRSKKVVFLDELAWMDTKQSDFMSALEFFWNSWASSRKDVVLVVAASATSWILKKVIHSKGGLHNRLTHEIKLGQFTLGECREYCRYRGLEMNTYQLLELYMVLGGVPYYWSLLEKGKSPSQNIDALFFAEDAPLRKEYQYLFASLFKKPDRYLAIVAALGSEKKRNGLSRQEIAKKAKIGDSGDFSSKLEELEACGFLRAYRKLGSEKKETFYQLVDPFVLFYFKFMKEGTSDPNFYSDSEDTPLRNAWSGLAFEEVCLLHLPQIKEKLGISGVRTEALEWHCEKDEEEGIEGSQIDLLLARKDQIMDICEMKFSTDDYVLSASDEAKLRKKKSDLSRKTKTKSAVHFVLVTPYGLKENTHSHLIQSVVTGEDLLK